MQAVFLMAGKGSRMARDMAGPKQLMEVGGKAVIEHTIDNLPDSVDSLVFVVGGPHEETIRAHFSEGFYGQRPITFVRQEVPRGTADAFWSAEQVIMGPFLGLLSDEIIGKETLAKLAAEPGCAILARRVENPSNFGVIVPDSEGNVLDFVEKPKDFVSDLVWAGGLHLDPEFVTTRVPLSERGEYEVPNVIMELIRTGKKFKIIETNEWLTVNDKQELLAARALLSNK